MDVALAEEGDDTVDGQGSTDTIAGGEGTDVLANSAEIDETFTIAQELIDALNGL